MAEIQGMQAFVHQSYRGGNMVMRFAFYEVSNAGITFSDLNAFGVYLLGNLIPVLDVLQSDQVFTSHIHLQARGTSVPSNDYLYGSNASKSVALGNQLPPELCYYMHWGTADTLDSLTGDPNTTNPVQRGGLYISGADDTYLSGGQFVIPPGDEPDWAALIDFMTDEHTAGGRIWRGGVIGEQIVSGTGWRVAAINGGLLKRITKLRSRMA